MIVCMIAEGCYPYITGGVSGWIHQLISGMPHISFKIVSLMPSRSEELKQSYILPSNVLEIKTIFLDDYLLVPHKQWKKQLLLKEADRNSLRQLIYADEQIDWPAVVEAVAGAKIGTTVDFLQSAFFWETVVELYQEKYPQESFNTFFWSLRTMLLPFLHLLQQELPEADVYHAVSTGYAGILGACYRQQSNKPLVLTEHGIYAREREEEILKAKWVTGMYKRLWIDFFYFLSKIAYQQADKIIALFQRNQDIQRELGAPAERSVVIPNGIEYNCYTEIYRQNVQVKGQNSEYKVGAILRVVPIKDVMTLIRSFKVVKAILPKVKLYLIGPTEEDPDYYRQCLNLVKILDLEQAVVFTGRVNVMEYLNQVDVLVLTSISEGQPLVILEGMAAGLPVIATDVGACREMLEENSYEGDCGRITRLVTPNETATQIIRLLEDRHLRIRMGINGRQRVMRAYSQEQLLNSYAQIYQKLG